MKGRKRYLRDAGAFWGEYSPGATRHPQEGKWDGAKYLVIMVRPSAP